MFSVEFLNKIRSHELKIYKSYLPKGSKVLEIGGGTGIQAKHLAELGLDVSSVDINASTYSGNRVFPIVDYDGKNLPFESGAFDIVFSSNVLEHIKDISNFHIELKRVLKNGGISVHAMPTSTWRFWTIIAHYVELLQRILQKIPCLFPKLLSINEISRIRNQLVEILRTIKYFIIPPRHGEVGNCITELYSFSRHYWKCHFKKNNYILVDVKPMGLFYTGHMILCDKLPLKFRECLSRFLGSSCVLYYVDKKVSK